MVPPTSGQFISTQPTTLPNIQVVLVPTPLPALSREPSVWSSPSLWISLASAAVASGSFWNSLRQRRVAEAQHSTAEAQRKIAEAQHATAEEQRRTASEKLRLDLFEKRLNVYTTVRRAFTKSITGKAIDHELSMAVNDASRMAEFLFHPNVAKVVSDLWLLCLDRSQILRDSKDVPREALPEDVRSKNDALQKEFDRLYKISWKMFPPYIDFTNVGVAPVMQESPAKREDQETTKL